MEQLQYIIEDRTIVELLGTKNFTNVESAILELVKNAYDANADNLIIEFKNNSITINDDGVGMDEADIRQHWMHVGGSVKGYDVIDKNERKRILAGSKGIGRFALSCIGGKATISTKKNNSVGITWSTDWQSAFFVQNETIKAVGTCIVITELREKWTKKR